MAEGQPQATGVDGASSRAEGLNLGGRRVVFVVNVDWFFLSHRLPVARAAAARGARVTVITADTGRAERIRAEGFEHRPLRLSRRGRNPLSELRVIWDLARLYRTIEPDLIHHVTIKPVLYGSLAARLAVPAAGVVNAVSGLGFAFSERGRGFRPLVLALYRLALNHTRAVTVFQNPHDRALFAAEGLVSHERSVLIRGSGVDITEFTPTEIPSAPPVVMLAARLLWDKGIGEFVAAARAVKRARPDVRFVVVGEPDPGNPGTVPEGQLRAWGEEGDVEFWGFRSDMREVLSQATLVVLPTYYPEGVPKILLEAAAMGRPMIATDAPGCREIVRAGETGWHVPVRDAPALAEVVLEALEDQPQLAALGRSARRLVLDEFSEEIVVDATLGVYRDLLDRSPR